MNIFRYRGLRWIGFVLLAASVAAQPADAPAVKVSAFAPAKDLEGQVKFFLGRLEEGLASKEVFDEAKQSRVRKDANTLSAIGLLLAKHDQESDLRSSGPALLKAAQHLAAAEGDYDQAFAALADLKKAAAGQSAGGEPPAWGKVASLGALMKQVPLVHSGLKRGVEGARFARQADQAAGQAATLAAIAQSSMFDNSEVHNPGEEAKWREFCTQMRDAAGQINAAAHAGDQQAARAGLKTLSESCDRCHEVFRKEHKE